MRRMKFSNLLCVGVFLAILSEAISVPRPVRNRAHSPPSLVLDVAPALENPPLRHSKLEQTLLKRRQTEGTCDGRCDTNYDPAYSCQCNDECMTYGDCCEDHAPICLGETCSGKCSNRNKKRKPCQCNAPCSENGNCCSDYVVSCASCDGRCGQGFDGSKHCQCNTACPDYGNCCSDYADLCVAETCEGRCGQDYDGYQPCQCDSTCYENGDCCLDYVPLCASCSGKCDQGYVPSDPCQCNALCSKFGNCCPDYVSSCVSPASCIGRCDQGYDSTELCQCNSLCSQYGNCCPDYDSECTGPGVTLSDTIQAMWDADVNRLASPADIAIDTTGSSLFTSVDETELAGPTYQAFVALLDNYDRRVGEPEEHTAEEAQEIAAFVDVIMQTDVMSLAYVFLEANNEVNSNAEFLTLFEELWFNPYTRSSQGSTDDSSGFEHVLVGETKATNSEVSGFHNWLQIYREEQNGNLVYSHMVKTAEPSQKAVAFDWFGFSKAKASFFLGTSPEFDLAVYTLCAIRHKNAPCNFQLQGTSVFIQTWDINHKDGNQIGSAYPVL